MEKCIAVCRIFGEQAKKIKFWLFSRADQKYTDYFLMGMRSTWKTIHVHNMHNTPQTLKHVGEKFHKIMMVLGRYQQ